MVPSLLLLQSIVPRYPSPIPGSRYTRSRSVSPTPSSTSSSSTNHIHTTGTPTALDGLNDVDLESFRLQPSYHHPCIRSPSVCDQELWEVGSWCSSPRRAAFSPRPISGTIARATLFMGGGARKHVGAMPFMPAGGSTGHALSRPGAAPASQLAADMLHPSRAGALLTPHATLHGSQPQPQQQQQQQTLSHVGAEQRQAHHASPPATGDEQMAKSSDSQLIACPFYKWRPEKFSSGEYRACARGFQDIHYLKDHIKAKHLGPSVCLRCKAEFENELAADQHLENEDCPRGYNQLFVDEHFILSRAVRNRIFEKKSRKEDNERCWTKIWHLIFPAEPTPANIFVPEDADAILDAVQKQYPGSDRAALAEVQKQTRAQLRRGPQRGLIRRKKNNTNQKATGQETPQLPMLPSKIIEINGTMQSAAHVYAHPASRGGDPGESTLDMSSTNEVSSSRVAHEWYSGNDFMAHAVAMPPNQVPAISTPTSLTSRGRASPQTSALSYALPTSFQWQDMSKPGQSSPAFDHHAPDSQHAVHRTTGLSHSDAPWPQSLDSRPTSQHQYFPPFPSVATTNSYPAGPGPPDMHAAYVSYQNAASAMGASPSHSSASHPQRVLNHVQFPPQSLHAPRRWAPYSDYYRGPGAGSPFQNAPH